MSKGTGIPASFWREARDLIMRIKERLGRAHSEVDRQHGAEHQALLQGQEDRNTARRLRGPHQGRKDYRSQTEEEMEK